MPTYLAPVPSNRHHHPIRPERHDVPPTIPQAPSEHFTALYCDRGVRSNSSELRPVAVAATVPPKRDLVKNASKKGVSYCEMASGLARAEHMVTLAAVQGV